MDGRSLFQTNDMESWVGNFVSGDSSTISALPIILLIISWSE
jgi:hypothetical protein